MGEVGPWELLSTEHRVPKCQQLTANISKRNLCLTVALWSNRWHSEHRWIMVSLYQCCHPGLQFRTNPIHSWQTRFCCCRGKKPHSKPQGFWAMHSWWTNPFASHRVRVAFSYHSLGFMLDSHTCRRPIGCRALISNLDMILGSWMFTSCPKCTGRNILTVFQWPSDKVSHTDAPWCSSARNCPAYKHSRPDSW